jgi:hypothetical protein
MIMLKHIHKYQQVVDLLLLLDLQLEHNVRMLPSNKMNVFELLNLVQ